MNEKLITTQRLILEPFSEKFISDKYLSWLNNPEIVKYSELRHRTHTIEMCNDYYCSFIGSPHFIWAILLKAHTNIHIGNITAHIDLANSVADIGILIGDINSWGNGYGYEAWQNVCRYLFQVQKIRKITAGTLSLNIAMQKIMKRVGMKLDGVRSKQVLCQGQAVDVIHYCIFNECA